MKRIFLLLCIACLCVPAAQAQEQSRKPNIVLILADDLGIGDVSAYQSNHIPTPHIDSLGRSGIRFTDAHVSAAVCMPSRAGLITGRQGTRHGSEFNAGPGLAVAEQNIAELLKPAGYRSAAIGKWHLGAQDNRDPLSQGFDFFYGLHGGASNFIDPLSPEAVNGYGVTIPNSATANTANASPQAIELFRGRESVAEKEYLTDAFTREAVNFIGDNRDKPFFLYLAYNAPHSPHQTIRKYYDRFPHISDHASRVYAAMVSAVDDGVGEVIKKLRSENLEQNTLVIFLSDNGGPDYFRGGPSNANYAGWKRYHLEGGHRVPLFLSWPTKLPSNQIESRLTSSLDLLPTIISIAGAETPRDRKLDGVNLIPYLTNKVQGVPHETLYWRAGVNYAVREGKWKLLVVNKAPEEQLREFDKQVNAGLLRDGPYQGISPLGQHTFLFDLESDPSEAKNLASAHEDLVASLKQKYEVWNQDNVAPNAKSTRGIPTVIDGVTVQLAF